MKSKLEARYAAHLRLLKQAGEIHFWAYEPLRLRLADGALYTPDFGVVGKDGVYECHETKGHWREAALVRIKVASALHPFRFVAVEAADDGWSYRRFE